MKIKSKVWLEKNGQFIFGSGKASIFKQIDKTGSINKAAKKMKMSYRHVWSCIRSVEKRQNRRLFIKIKGGANGGGTKLTDYAKDLIMKFEKIDKEVRDFVDRRCGEIFNE